MSKIVGIDLGTTNSGVAVVEGGTPRMLPNGDERIIPSVVGYSPSGEWLVGTPARNQYIYNPENTVRSVKRSMGTGRRFTLGGHEFSPQEISAFILRELKQIAERHLDEEVTDAVITVPAYFPDAARQATRDAGRIAGFNVRRIINEPTAAALAYGLDMAEEQLALVYDLGGGTFDASLVEIVDGVIEVRASHGDTQLGGDDFDHRLAEEVAEWFLAEYDVDLREERRAWARLLRAAEAAKIELSSHPFAWIKEEYLTEKDGVPLHLEYEVSRQMFEEAIDDLITKTVHSIDQVLTDGEVGREELTQVLMVGGSSRIPAVWERVAHHLDIEPQMTLNPEEVVALGASVQAAIIAGEPIDAILVDVTPYSLGIAVADVRMGQVIPDRYKVLIHRNTTIPVTRADLFTTVYPDQDAIEIKVYQGESPIASENTLLGSFKIEDLEAEAPGELPKVTVEFDMGVNGILSVTAEDRKTGQQKQVTLEATPERLSEQEILSAKQEINEPHITVLYDSQLSDEDRALLQRAESLLVDGALSSKEKEQLAALLSEIQLAKQQKDQARLDEELEELLDLLFDLES
jgi:molecular chaperone DnaK